ncbi:MAG TPA: AbrB/MazE/SpoVT family DNA-binding domain-containing protein [Candidatus Acidoferrum sp.]|jgi:AbrB family looped-hinge helix DNA binding protein
MKSEVGTVTTKGQLVIPAKLRRKYEIREGTRIAFVEDGNRLVLQPLTSGFIRSLRGSLKGRSLDILYEERKRDREL